MLCEKCDAVVISICMYEMLICGNAGENYMKCKYFWCVIILSHVIIGYADSRRTMEFNQERGMKDRRYERERPSCVLSSLSFIMASRL